MKGQWEAAYALGLRPNRALSLVVIPQAMRVMIPPLTSQYLNVLKNSSFGAAIAFPELVSVFVGSALTNTGQAIEIIAITLGDLPCPRAGRLRLHELVQRQDAAGDAMTAASTLGVMPVRASLLRRLRADYFSTPLNALVSLVCIAAIVAMAVPILRWAVWNADLAGTTRADCTSGGACWVFVKARFGQFMYGFYPPAERWRVNLAARAG